MLNKSPLDTVRNYFNLKCTPLSRDETLGKVRLVSRENLENLRLYLCLYARL